MPDREEKTTIPAQTNSINGEIENQSYEKRKTSNLGCFLCAQLLTVTKQRVGLSQTQLRIILNDRCTELPPVFRSQCFVFVSDSLPQIYVSLTYNMSVKDICEMLNLCDSKNPFINERLIEETLKKHQTSTTTTTEASPREETDYSKGFPSMMTTTNFPPVIIGNELTTPSPFEERKRPYPSMPGPKVMPLGPPTTEKTEVEEESQIPDFKELASKTGGLPQPPSIQGPDGKKVGWSKRLTCLFCERMLNNAKSYAISAKSEISAFANATCSRISEPEIAEQCFQLTDRKINELAVFVDEQVVEALWCAQLNHC